MLNFIKNIIENLFNIKITKKETVGINIENSSVHSPIVNGHNNTTVGNSQVLGNSNTTIGNNHNVKGEGNIVMGPTERDFKGDNNIMIG